MDTWEHGTGRRGRAGAGCHVNPSLNPTLTRDRRAIEFDARARLVRRRAVDEGGGRSVAMFLDRVVVAVARRAMSSSASSSSALGARSRRAAVGSWGTTATAAAATPTMRGGGVGEIARRGVITIPVDNGDAERAYRRLRKIMVSEGIYKELRESTTGHRKPAELRVLARKERERRTRRSKLNSKLGWIMRQKERGF